MDVNVTSIIPPCACGKTKSDKDFTIKKVPFYPVPVYVCKHCGKMKDAK